MPTSPGCVSVSDWDKATGLHRQRSGPDGELEEDAPPHKWRRRLLIAVPVVVLALLVGYLIYLNLQLSGIRRAPFLADVGGPHGAGTNVLLVGSEARGDALAADPDTLVVQLVHVSADGHSAAVVNLPRDLLLAAPVDLETEPAGSAGSRTVADAYRADGNALLDETVQQALGLNIDHIVQVSFSAYQHVTDRLGGVDMPTAEGERHFTGSQALAYADAADLPGGTVETGQRHQQWMKAMIADALHPLSLLNPFRLVGLLHDTTPRMVVDDSFTSGAMRGLAWHSRHLGAAGIRYLTAPHGAYGTRTGVGRVLLPNAAALRQLGEALRTDNAAAIATFDN